MRARALVLLNPAARQGAAPRRFRLVEEVLRRDLDLTVVPTDLEGRWRAALEDEVGKGLPLAIAAGGDGTVSAVASALLACPRGSQVALGAVGLGSSNDFLKPFSRVHRGVPLRVDLEHARPRDLGRARFSREGEAPKERLFLASASLGVTARANARFNGRERSLRFLKRCFVDGAILYAALATLVHHRDIEGVVRVEGEEGRFSLSNLSLLKTPFLSGCLRYDTPVEPDSGVLAAHLCHDMGRRALLGTLAALLRGRFAGRPGTRSWTTPWLEVELAEPTALELDGEVVEARKARFDVLARRMLACA